MKGPKGKNVNKAKLGAAVAYWRAGWHHRCTENRNRSEAGGLILRSS